MSEDLPVWEGIEKHARQPIFQLQVVWGPTCLRRYWELSSGFIATPPSCLRTYLFEKVLRTADNGSVEIRDVSEDLPVWEGIENTKKVSFFRGDNRLRTYLFEKVLRNDRPCCRYPCVESEDLPVWEGIEKPTWCTYPAQMSLRTYLFEKVLRISYTTSLYFFFSLRTYLFEKVLRTTIFNNSSKEMCLRTYLFEKVLRIFWHPNIKKVKVWGPTCLRRYWEGISTCHMSGGTVWGPTCLRRYWEEGATSYFLYTLSEDLPVWEGIENLTNCCTLTRTSEDLPVWEGIEKLNQA